jgi:hypothetical protein
MPLFPAFAGNLGAATVAAAAINTAAQTDIGPDLTIPANVAQAGVTYYYAALLNITAIGTAGSVVHTIQPFWGGIGGTSLVSLALTNSANTVVGGIWSIRVSGYVSFVSTTSCQSSIVVEGGLIGGNASNAVYGASGYFTQTGLTTNVSKVLTLSYQLGATTGSPSITPEFAIGYRVA